jgi:hypothetical protein
MKHTKESLTALALQCNSIAGMARKLGSNPHGGMHSYISKRVKYFGVDISHFPPPALRNPSKKGNNNKRSLESIVVNLSDNDNRIRTIYLRRALKESGTPYECAVCGLGSEWNGQNLVLEVDHIDGNWRCNEKDNLRFICPNCHSQQPTSKQNCIQKISSVSGPSGDDSTL